MTRTLYFHIGNHKTGSTSIQSALVRSNDPSVFNVKNPNKPKSTTVWHGNTWVCYDDEQDWHDMGFFDDKFTEELCAHNPDGNVVFSSEDASWIFSPHKIDALAQKLKPEFDDIKIISYLRRQDRNAVSFHQQGSRMGRSRIREFMGNWMGALPPYQPHYDLYFDFNKRLGHWADAFGDNAMNIFIFGDLLKGSNLVRSFFEFVGVDTPSEELVKRQSISKPIQYINSKIHELDIDLTLSDMLLQVYDEGKKMTPPRAQAEEFYAHFHASNIELQKRFSINDREAVFDEDFSEYSPDGNERLNPDEADALIEMLLLSHARSDARRRELYTKLQELKSEQH